ncbi:hypothetical protein A8M58_20795 [Yersinia pestis]|nr:hypothetical protein A8M58_20795 [Yersinia pestis]
MRLLGIYLDVTSDYHLMSGFCSAYEGDVNVMFLSVPVGFLPFYLFCIKNILVNKFNMLYGFILIFTLGNIAAIYSKKRIA